MDPAQLLPITAANNDLLKEGYKGTHLSSQTPTLIPPGVARLLEFGGSNHYSDYSFEGGRSGLVFDEAGSLKLGKLAAYSAAVTAEQTQVAQYQGIQN